MPNSDIVRIDDLGGNALVQTGNVFQQLGRGRIDVSTDTVDDLHDRFVKTLVQCLSGRSCWY